MKDLIRETGNAEFAVSNVTYGDDEQKNTYWTEPPK